MIFCLFLLLCSASLKEGFIFSSIARKIIKHKEINSPIIVTSNDNTVNKKQQTNITAEDKYNLNWYVIGEEASFQNNKLYNIKVWNNNYVVWKQDNNYFALDDDCSHRGASLSLGCLSNSNIVCPYHGYEFNSCGTLVKVPGLNFTNTEVQNQNKYSVHEQNGWVYLNTINKLLYNPEKINIYSEPEEFSKNFSKILLHFNFNSFARIISENSLDIMHIGFVHTFGNKENPSPVKEIPPYSVGDYSNHYKTEYEYKSGPKSIAKTFFSFDKLKIENEFILPHTTIARVIFGKYTSTVITNTLPLNLTHSTLFVKTYRNFWNTNDASIYGYIYNYFGDIITKITMTNTVFQDKRVIESIKPQFMDGKFNMKYDKLQSVYKTLYKNYIFNVTKLH